MENTVKRLYLISTQSKKPEFFLLVCSFVIPACFGLKTNEGIRDLKLVFIASVISIWLSLVIGIILSYKFDFPTGPAISVTNSILLLINIIVKKFVF